MPLSNPRRLSQAIRALLFVVVVVGAVAFPSVAHAYAWMIRHEYSACVQCHADPSGGSLLTEYGRAQGEVLLRTPYTKKNDEEEPGRIKDFLGFVHTPDTLLLGGDVRTLAFGVIPAQGPSTTRLIWMQADLAGQVSVDRFRANVSLGYADEGALPAALTTAPRRNLVSRAHWIGVDLGEEKQFLLRAGRMNLPFGLRSVEHTQWVRTSTRTNINDQQDDGVAFAYNTVPFRAEVMALAGNLQVRPSQYRDYGATGYLEYATSQKSAVGVQALVTHAERDVLLQTGLWRHAYGAFGRWAPTRPLVLLGEANVLYHSQPPTAAGGRSEFGTVAMLQADFEVIQGVHAMGTGELRHDATAGDSGVSLSAWGSAAWFFAPHADVRVDAIYQSLAAGPARSGLTELLGQLHLFL